METFKNTNKKLYSFTDRQLNVLGIYETSGVVGFIVGDSMVFADKNDLGHKYGTLRTPVTLNDLRATFASIDEMEAEKQYSEIN